MIRAELAALFVTKNHEQWPKCLTLGQFNARDLSLFGARIPACGVTCQKPRHVACLLVAG